MVEEKQVGKTPSRRMTIPEPGQIVRVRNQTFLVQDVHPYLTSEATFYKVTLESLEDHRLGTSLEVIWELEVSPRVEELEFTERRRYLENFKKLW